MTSNPGTERRKFSRLNAPVLCRPMRATLMKPEKRSVQDISEGGVCVYSDERHKLGEKLEMEFFLPSMESLTLAVEVVWIDALEEKAPAKYEIGLRFLDMGAEDKEKLKGVLKETKLP